MDGRRPTSTIVAGIFFLIVFGGLTVAALASAELNLATIVIAAISLFVVIAVVGALIGAVRQPPEQ